MENLISECKSFIREKIWITKKCRILAEERQNKLELKLKIAVIIWTTVGFILSLIGDKSNEYYSSIVTATIVGISSLSFALNSRLNAQNYKNSYIKLSILEEKANLLLDTEGSVIDTNELLVKFFDIKKEYYSILKNSDNHTDFDYQRLMSRSKETRNKINVFGYRLKWTFDFVIFTMLYLLPILISIYIII